LNKDKPKILLTNDDGIQSPGLWTAAEALSEIGYVNVVAPREQSTGAGRSMPASADGIIKPQEIEVGGQTWTVYAVGGTPAQTVQHGVLEVLPDRPDLVVAGINYGQNVGSGVTISGTVGAALEAAGLGIPSMAVSLETEDRHHLSYSLEVDFSAAAHFTALFGRVLLEKMMPFDVDVLKIDIPADAEPTTPWEVTRLSRERFYESIPPDRASWSEPAKLHYRQFKDTFRFPPGTDVHTLMVKRRVSVTPLSLDLTSRVDLDALEEAIRDQM
jgi:5'-nucleotidase